MRPVLTFSLLALCAVSAASHAQSGDSFSAGLGLAYVPEYAGANDSRVLPLPLLEWSWASGWFASTQRGLGYQTRLGDFSVSAALGYDGGRDDHKRNYFAGSDALRGMGDIDSSAQAVLSVSYQLGAVGVALTTKQNINHREYGATYTLGLTGSLYASGSEQFGWGVSAQFGDRKHAQTWFGVTAAQSAASGYRAYGAGAGLETVTAGLNWTHVIDSNWVVRSGAGLTRLTGDAADSPLTKRRTTPMVMTALIYRF